uniref:Uncharacterized protein n=1 Tax=Glossina brevipalpis TaxID=37001 RepID=A0A1A9WZ81_9MUSC
MKMVPLYVVDDIHISPLIPPCFSKNKIQLEADESNLAELRRVHDKKNQEMSEYEEQLKQIVDQNIEPEQQFQRGYKRLNNQSKPCIEQHEILETKLIDFRSKVHKAKAGLTLFETELKILKSEEISESHKLESKINSYEESQQILNEKKIIGDELRQNLSRIKSDIQEKLKLSRELQQAEEDMTALLMTIRAKISDATTMRTCENKPMNFVMLQKIEGITGVLGRLGDMDAIDNTAYQSLDSIAEATFIPLEKIKYLESHSAPFQTPENVPRLYDLVHVDNFALHDTLVVSNLEQSSHIDDMQTQANKLQLDINFYQEQQSLIERKIQKLTRIQQRTEFELKKVLITTRSLETLLPYLLEQIEAQRIRLQETIVDAKNVRIDAEIEIKKAILVQATPAENDVTEQVTQIRNQIDYLYLIDQVHQVSNNIPKIKGELTTYKRNIDMNLERNIIQGSDINSESNDVMATCSPAKKNRKKLK